MKVIEYGMADILLSHDWLQCLHKRLISGRYFHKRIKPGLLQCHAVFNAARDKRNRSGYGQLAYPLEHAMRHFPH